MNYWTQLSIDFANQRDYLDELFRVYPMVPDHRRAIAEDKWKKVESSFQKRNQVQLVEQLLNFELFPIKDSYVAYLKRDHTAIERNPKTVSRLAGRLFEMGLDEVWKRCTEPKETNRQIGPLFQRWIRQESLGVPLLSIDEFVQSDQNAVLSGGDEELKSFATQHLNYHEPKGLDLVARFNGHFVLGESKFLTDFGGHQNAQFNDAIKLVENEDVKAVTVAILDGVIYIPNKGKMYTHLDDHPEQHIMSALVLREFLYSL